MEEMAAHGRRSSNVGKGVFGGVWSWQIEAPDGVSLPNGLVFNSIYLASQMKRGLYTGLMDRSQDGKLGVHLRIGV